MKYQATALADIPLPELVPHKVTLAQYGAQDHNRWVFRGRSSSGTEPLFYKIWNSSYVRRDNILAAIDSGFYDERTVPALHSVIFHDGICRGYVMRQGLARQTTINEEFRDLVFLRTAQTAFFTVQFAPWHVMRYQDRWSLLDLEGVYAVKSFPDLAHYHCEFENAAYEKFVSLLHQHLPVCANAENATGSDKVVSLIRQALAESASQESDVIASGLHIRLARRLTLRLRNLVPRINLIEY